MFGTLLCITSQLFLFFLLIILLNILLAVCSTFNTLVEMFVFTILLLQYTL